MKQKFARVGELLSVKLKGEELTSVMRVNIKENGDRSYIINPEDTRIGKISGYIDTDSLVFPTQIAHGVVLQSKPTNYDSRLYVAHIRITMLQVEHRQIQLGATSCLDVIGVWNSRKHRMYGIKLFSGYSTAATYFHRYR